MRKNIFFIILLFVLNIEVSALTYGGCDYSSVSRMKSLVNNVNIYYDYHIQNNEAYFDVTITNIVPGMRFVDSYNDKTYYYADTNNGELVISGYDGLSGNYKFYFDNPDCQNVRLGAKYYSFPYYNPYYEDSECRDIPEFSLCQKWVSKYYSHDKFLELIDEYKEIKYSDDDVDEVEDVKGILDVIIDFYLKNYYLILPPVILVFGLIVVIHWRRTRFKL